MAKYEIWWSSPGGQGHKLCDTAAVTDAWISEFQDKGADAIKVTRNGVLIEIGDLARFMREETLPAEAKL